ncbi:MAG: DUF4446 family protein [Clostridia bacterium]|nr:DUF4446 family protein [Clostridia bacterium]
MNLAGFVSQLMAEGQLLPLILSVVLLAATVVFVVSNAHLRRLSKSYRSLLAGQEGRNLETLILEYIGRVDALGAEIEKTKTDLLGLQSAVLKHVQKVGLVRYDAFDDIGGEQSFSVALLDANANGLVISGLCGREETRVYAKPVNGGRSNHTLSTEEIRAIARAIEEYRAS